MFRVTFPFLLAMLSLNGCGAEASIPGGSGGAAGDAGGGGMGGGGLAVWPCTEQGIRDAITLGGGPHTFGCDGPTTVMTGAPIEIDDDIILDGEGNLTVDAGGSHRVFIVGTPFGVGPEPVEVELRNMTIAGGFTSGGFGTIPELGGGGVLSGGVLAITGCTITNNEAPGGSGIESLGTLTVEDSRVFGNRGTWAISHQGEITIQDSTVSDNVGGGLAFARAQGRIFSSTFAGNSAVDGEYGGAIRNTGDLFVLASVIRGNEAERGGGVWNTGELSLVDTTIADNNAVDGGGIYNADPHLADRPIFDIGILSLTRSTMSGNTAQRGGGIYTAGLWQRLTNSTVSGNTAEMGGGIAMAGTLEGPSSLTLANATIADNEASEGSAIWATGDSPELRFIGTIVEGGCQEGAGTVTWTSRGSNIESPGDTCGFSDESDEPSVAPSALMLGPLLDNGGFTETHAPAAGSAAVDAMVPEDCPLSLPEPLGDQRYARRPIGPACDVGSVEFEP
jgi:hypothetical protein